MKYPALVVLMAAACVVAAPTVWTSAAVAAPAKMKKVQTPKAAPLSAEQMAMRLRDTALKDNKAYAFVAELTTRFGARPAGSASEKAAAEWSAQQFKAMGFDKVRIESFPLEIWERGDEKLAITGPFPQSLVATALGGSGTTPPEGIEAEAALFETYDAFASGTDDVKGKIVVILQPTVRTQTGVGYGVNSGSVRRQGPEVGRTRGAVGYVMRSLGTEDQRFAHTGGTRFLGPEGLPSLAISPPDAEQLERILGMQRAGTAGPVRMHMLSTPKFLGPGTSQNVIAEITGATRPHEIITIGGHLDSWDLGTGALDDGAGVAITMAAAKAILDSGVRPARTIRVVFWGSEEVSQPNDQGLTGAYAYANAYAAEFPNHIAAAESDFGADVIYSLTLPKSDSPEFNQQLGRVLYPLGIYMDRNLSTGGGPDTTPLYNAGVPVFDLNQDGNDYFDTHHTVDDVLDRINPAKMDQNVAAWAATLWMMADTNVRFTGKVVAP